MTKCILHIFAQASGLVTNMSKTECYPIRCSGTDLSFITAHQLKLASFPCTYLRLPLNIRNPGRTELHSMIQKIGTRLPGWKRRYFTYPGRELLVKTVLNSMPTYFMTIFNIPKWAISRVDRFRRSFLWKGTNHEDMKGGHCLVN